MAEYQILNFHTQYCDCLSMKLQLIPVANTANHFQLSLNLDFTPQEKKILHGNIKFALRVVRLYLNLENINLIEANETKSPLIKKIDNPLSRLPYWEIRHITDSKFLEGHLDNVILGTVEIQTTPYQLTATLKSKLAHVYLSQIEGLWRHDITPNKHAVLERKLAKFIWQTNLKPFVAETIFSSDEITTNSTHSQEKEDDLLKELKEILQIIYQTPKDDFSDLAQIAGLNPLVDFAGGDLTGANLSGLKLSSADFKYVNLRGADLTDVDLSEANISYAKLNGADLSGAYLEGANLRFSNLQSASLALANLIGADLTGANLLKTNLTKTTLAQALVEGTIFGDNIEG
ncbi:pentapeptide repeat-containing protein [Cyanobacterium stanieri LEGE 03274]|uniref:Pentapeptide repeat-containing protein n=1 Tax=Cyanobacterium stanieri LEGE 03274 TaxID=1828756 RepID=A0ABR9V648_9CHRO|nr:pentapeptide repeat-containing protein [Cyanobacterium stanieri]MBE9222319.1 pentapeptide repeat-containing protein [Cyanobacterium stanieri LEGE 03274]